MKKIEQEIINKYVRHITKLIKAKYKRKAKLEAQEKRLYLESSGNMRKKYSNLEQEIYKTYTPIIEEEIKFKTDNFIESGRIEELLEAEKEIKKLNYKSLKKYQEFPIGINESFINEIYKEINNEEDYITKDEIKYILLNIFYKIIEYIKNGYIIKIGTVLKIWADKRDVRINLPNVRDRILEDRVIPKVALCKSFNYKLFHSLNNDNEAILNYYKSKVERFLKLFTTKQGNK